VLLCIQIEYEVILLGVVMFRLLITGSRTWEDKQTILLELREIVREYGTDVTLVSGNAIRGADYICETFARNLGWLVEKHPAEWDKFGKSAGFKRNELMVTLGADACLAFIKDKSRGASDTAERAVKAGIPTKRVEV
tara:strand:+ start:101 stop:511 length:411 start_codon:yes stop_codon:yes gene_type:complete